MQGKGGSGLFIYNKNLYIIGGANREQQDQFDIWMIDEQQQQQKLIDNLGLVTGQSQVLFQDKIYITGGQNFLTNQQISQFYYFDLKNNQINQIQFIDKRILERNSHSMLVFDQNIIIFGGANYKGPLNDLWFYNINQNQWKQQQLNEIDKEFKPREMHTSHIYFSQKKLQQLAQKDTIKLLNDEFQNKKVIELDFGGAQQQKDIINNISKLNITDDIQIEQNQDTDIQKEQKQDFYNYIIVIGGRFLQEILDEIQVIDLQNLNTYQIFKLPFQICAHASVLVEDLIYIIGGTDGTQFFNKIWIYDIQENQIYECQLDNQFLIQFEQRIACSAILDQQNKQIIIFGGSYLIFKQGKYQKETNDFIKLDLLKYNTKNRTKKL